MGRGGAARLGRRVWSAFRAPAVPLDGAGGARRRPVEGAPAAESAVWGGVTRGARRGPNCSRQCGATAGRGVPADLGGLQAHLATHMVVATALGSGSGAAASPPDSAAGYGRRAAFYRAARRGGASRWHSCRPAREPRTRPSPPLDGPLRRTAVSNPPPLCRLVLCDCLLRLLHRGRCHPGQRRSSLRARLGVPHDAGSERERERGPRPPSGDLGGLFEV